MRNLYKSIDYIERGLFRGLERKAAPPPPSLERTPKLSIRAWRAPVSKADAAYSIEQVFGPS